MTKPLCVIQSPFETRSGYGDLSRDVIRHIIELDLYNVKLISLPWGACPMNALDPIRDVELIKRIIAIPVQLPRQPELFIQISVPNEFQPIGKFNIGITAGIETTAISLPWVQGCNRMNVVWATSEHSRQAMIGTVIEEHHPSGQMVASHKINVPVEVLHCCVHTNIFKKLPSEQLDANIKSSLAEIREKFCYLFVGHWLKGDVGEDRKNVGLLVKLFCETFKNVSEHKRPALILKTSGAGFSLLDREECLNKIKTIRNSVGSGCPNVYLLHGDLTESEMNSLYNHPKVKVHVSFTKGEGFGRPLLEATMSEKPVIASGWSGHLDFLNPQDVILVGGEVRQVEPAAVWEGVIIAESGWFNVDQKAAMNALMFTFKKYDQLLLSAKRIAKKNRTEFNYDVIKAKTADLLQKHVPKMAVQVPLQLPTLRKIGSATKLPTLKKVTSDNADQKDPINA
jgi:glycosyltransferase involved in cell wall biosynthesis